MTDVSFSPDLLRDRLRHTARLLDAAATGASDDPAALVATFVRHLALRHPDWPPATHAAYVREQLDALAAAVREARAALAAALPE